MKSSTLSRAFFEKPPHYEHEVLANLEEFNLKADTDKKINNDFAKILGGLDQSAKDIVSTITNESERSRIQAQINAEKIEAGISETNYNLLDISCGINSLEDSMRESSQELRLQIRSSSEDIVKQIHESGKDIVEQLEITNNRLSSIDNNLLAINDSLKGIGSVLGIILERINKPNEVQAIELADQIRISLAIGKHEEALRVTRKAMELCSTSITVTAYHLMTLSLFNDEELKNESESVYKDFVNLINFKLFDSGSDTQSVRDEIYYVAYPALFALSRSLGGKILDETQRLYTSIRGDEKATEMLLTKPLKDKSTENMTLYPSPLRELHWTVILKEEIISNKAYDNLVGYIVRVAKSNILIKNELLILANKKLYESKVLHGLVDKTWHEDSATDEELECLNIFISMLPQHNIKLDEKILLLIDRHVNKFNLLINSELKEILYSFNARMREYIDNQYLIDWSNYKKKIAEVEEKGILNLEKITDDLSAKYHEHITHNTDFINSKVSENEERTNRYTAKSGIIEAEIESLQKKLEKVTKHHFYDDPNLGTIITAWVFGIVISIILLAVFIEEGFWTGLLILIIFVVAGYIIAGVGFIVAAFAEFFIFIVRSIFGRTEAAITYKKQQLEYQISNKKQEIYNIEENYHDISSIKKSLDESLKKMGVEAQDKILSCARLNIASYAEKYIFQLNKNYNKILSLYFYDVSSKNKIEQEMTIMINNNFPNDFSLSRNFNDKLKSLLSLFGNYNPSAESISSKLLFGEKITTDTLEQD